MTLFRIPHSAFHIFAPYLLVLTLGVAQAVWLTYNGVPCITSDHAVYHSPAVELATHGRLAIPCFGHLFPRTDVVFACYPPLYQLLLAGWYFLVGFGLRTALAFNFIIHILSALAVMRVTQLAMVKGNKSSRGSAIALCAVGILQLVYLVHFDRQEETALLWLWAEMLFCQGSGWMRAFLCGLFIGLAAMTSPWVGCLGALVVTFRTFFTARQHATELWDWLKAGSRLVLAGFIAALPVVSWAWFMESHYPGILHDQFFGTMRDIASHKEPFSLAGNATIFFNSFFYCHTQAPVFIATLLLLPWSYRAAVEKGYQPNVLALYATGWLAIILIAYVRPEATTYICAIETLLLPCFIAALGPYLSREGAEGCLGIIFLGLFVAFASQQAVQLAMLPWRWNEAERCDAVCRHLQELIPPGELVNITGRHWYCFQGRNPWHEAYFLREHDEELLRARWMVLPLGIGTPSCIDDYELIEKMGTGVAPNQTYAYSLWRRRH